MWLRDAKKFLIKNEKAKKMGENIQVCYSQPKNLKRLVTQKNERKLQNDTPGCFKRLTCDSSFVVYLGTCQKCGGQYVGKSTTPFKKRHSNHKQEVKKCYGGLGHHYGGQGCGYDNLSIQLIEQVKIGDQEALSRQEVFLQNQLRGYVQNGGHAHCYSKEKNQKK